MRLWSRPLIVAGIGVVPQGPEEGPPTGTHSGPAQQNRPRGGRAWPGFETTHRAKLAARTASGRAAGVIGHFVLLGLVPGVVVGGGVVEFVEADCVAPAGDGAGGLVGWLAWYQAFSRASSVGMVARIVAAGCGWGEWV